MPDHLQQPRCLPLLVLTGVLAVTGAQAQSGYRQQEDERGPPPRQFADPDRAANAAQRGLDRARRHECIRIDLDEPGRR